MGLEAPQLTPSLPGEEPFALDGLERHRLKEALLLLERQEDLPLEACKNAVLESWRLQGRLPPAPT